MHAPRRRLASGARVWERGASPRVGSQRDHRGGVLYFRSTGDRTHRRALRCGDRACLCRRIADGALAWSRVGSHSRGIQMDGCGRCWTRKPPPPGRMDARGHPCTRLGDLRIRRLRVQVLPSALTKSLVLAGDLTCPVLAEGLERPTFGSHSPDRTSSIREVTLAADTPGNVPWTSALVKSVQMGELSVSVENHDELRRCFDRID